MFTHVIAEAGFSDLVAGVATRAQQGHHWAASFSSKNLRSLASSCAYQMHVLHCTGRGRGSVL
jgi:hypothetical protein